METTPELRHRDLLRRARKALAKEELEGQLTPGGSGTAHPITADSSDSGAKKKSETEELSPPNSAEAAKMWQLFHEDKDYFFALLMAFDRVKAAVFNTSFTTTAAFLATAVCQNSLF